jgi:hypothetical protein
VPKYEYKIRPDKDAVIIIGKRTADKAALSMDTDLL